jgi:hypothetical protein
VAFVLSSPTTWPCTAAGSQCSVASNTFPGLGAATYDCTCTVGRWACKSGSAVACPQTVVTQTGVACTSGTDTTCGLTFTPIGVPLNVVCSCGASNTWSCSVGP